MQGLQINNGKNNVIKTSCASSLREFQGNHDMSTDESNLVTDDDFTRPQGVKDAKKKQSSSSRADSLIFEVRERFIITL